MNTQFPQETQETTQEALLRATLREHAPQTIDLEHGWVKISAQLSTQAEQTMSPRGLHWFPRQSQGERRLVRRWQVIALAAVLGVALIGAGLFGPFSNLLGGNQDVYAQVNQTRQDQGVTITLDKAFANLKETNLTFKITVPPELAKYIAAAPSALTLTYQGQALERGDWTAFLLSNNNAHVSSISFSAVNPPANTQEVTLTWHITQIWLRSQPTSQNHNIVDIKGDWTFTFTIPFHNDYSDPVVN